MATNKASKDKFSQRTFVDITMSAANTLTFKKIDFAVGLFQGVALKLHKIEYHPTLASYRELAANTDSFFIGLTLRNTLTALDPTDLSVIDSRGLIGMGAGVEPLTRPIVTDFTTLPEGGMLTLANPLYAAMITTGAAAASQCRIVIHYSFLSLAAGESMELLQTLLPGNV